MTPLRPPKTKLVGPFIQATQDRNDTEDYTNAHEIVDMYGPGTELVAYNAPRDEFEGCFWPALPNDISDNNYFFALVPEI